jgi:hypothetical protein
LIFIKIFLQKDRMFLHYGLTKGLFFGPTTCEGFGGERKQVEGWLKWPKPSAKINYY